MADIRKLARTARRPGKDRAAAIAAMVELARIYGEGRDGVPPNQGAARAWAERAAKLASPDGYYEITRIAGSACIATDNADFKQEHARYVVGTCDIDTIRRFGRPEIAYNAGIVCEYMADFFNAAGRIDECVEYIACAVDYYKLARELSVFVPGELSARAKDGATMGLERIIGALRSSPAPKMRPPHQYTFH
ncbi:MAG: hypothetical protein KGI97_08565 [Alphaproteobacteria bacterium]|nr:hypothetical protein [Alphaproteobacteria bacterium]